MAPHWRSWLADHATDHFGFLEKHQDIEVPAFITTGWFDPQNPAIKNFTGLAENAATEKARNGTRLIVGPWSHVGDQWDRKVGEVDFGPDAERDYYEVADRWFTAWLKGDERGLEEWPRVELFVMGANRWRAEDDWPLARTRYTDFYLHSKGSANTPAGDGLLLREAPSEEPPDRYVYDPRDPVMTLYTPPGQHEPQDQRRQAGGRQQKLPRPLSPGQRPKCLHRAQHVTWHHLLPAAGIRYAQQDQRHHQQQETAALPPGHRNVHRHQSRQQEPPEK